MSDTFLERTSSNSSNNQRIGTISVWLKRAKLGTTQYILANYIDGNNYGYFRFDSSDRLHYVNSVSGSHSTDVVTTRKFRDTFGWYHFCVSVDSTQGTGSNRVKIYVNGTQETAFDTGSYGSQNDSHRMWMASASGGHRMGSQQTTQSHFDGCMSHFHFIDGTAYAASSFGSTDSTTGEWKINTSPSVTYGSEGYFMLKNDNSLTDQSGEGNNFIVGNGTFTKTEDNPSCVFATWNILDSHYFWGATESSWATNGNTKARSGNSQYSSNTATMGASSGKYYWEIKITARTTGDYFHLGIKSKQDSNTSTALGVKSTDYCYKSFNGQSMSNNSSSAYGSTYTIGDIIGVAMDLDNNKLYFHKNGTYQNSGVPTSGSTGTGAISLTDPADTEFGFYMPAWSFNDGSGYGTIEANFGNGYFGTTAVASAGTNASGNGIFEYDVPTGYTALSTKGLNL